MIIVLFGGGILILISLCRTLILLLAVILVLRLMGKRQIGQLQPAELVITILLSQIAATPMQDNDIPAVYTLMVLSALAGVEVLLSAVSMKNRRVRELLDGVPMLIIKDGRLLQDTMKKLRYTIDDVLEALRQKDVFDISAVAYAVVETNGTLSVLLRPGAQGVTVSYMEKEPKDPGMPFVVIADGEIMENGLREAELDRPAVERILQKNKLRLGDVFLLTCDKTGKIYCVKKEAGT